MNCFLHRLHGLLLWLVGALTTASAQAAEVQVAVAANFAGPLVKLAKGFTAATGHSLTVSSGATGKFYSQIVAGAPFEVLLAADTETPAKLVKQGLAVAGSNFTYATGRLVLWSAQPGYVDDQGAVLASAKFAHLAIANPKIAPYGQAAMEVLKARGLVEALTPKLVTGETIAQTFQFIATGNAELGFVALSQVIAARPSQADQRPLGGSAPGALRRSASSPSQPAIGSYWLVPATLHGEIKQDGVLLKPGMRNPAAVALLSYLKSDAAKDVIRSYGYGH